MISITSNTAKISEALRAEFERTLSDPPPNVRAATPDKVLEVYLKSAARSGEVATRATGEFLVKMSAAAARLPGKVFVTSELSKFTTPNTTLQTMDVWKGGVHLGTAHLLYATDLMSTEPITHGAWFTLHADFYYTAIPGKPDSTDVNPFDGW